jgi:hypothetical protein
MIQVIISDTCLPEKKYILKILIGDFLGLEYKLVIDNSIKGYQFTNDGKSFTFCDVFFQDYKHSKESIYFKPPNVYDFKIESLCIPFPIRINHSKFTILYSLVGHEQFSSQNDCGFLGLDIFGSCFFMLSRLEELQCNKLDNHGRFPATESIAFKNCFLNRPIVNEYLEIFWSVLKFMWPELKRKKYQFKTIPSHDVDTPYQYHIKNYLELIYRMTISAAKLKPRNILKNYKNYSNFRKSGIKHDPFYTFDFLMRTSEESNIKSAFYFITDQKHIALNGNYLMTDSIIKNLLKEIHSRGHEIGLHPSYYTFDNQEQLLREFEILKDTCIKLNIIQNSWGGRQHVLRWKTPITALNWDSVGLKYDSTLCFADHAGFRCGTCYEYYLFDILSRKELNIIERPLVAMECTVIEDRYMGYGVGEKAFDYFKLLKDECKFYNGGYTILWHNDKLVSEEHKYLYKQVIKA